MSRQPENRVKDEPGDRSSDSSESESVGQLSSMQTPTLAYQAGSGTGMLLCY